MAMTAILDSTRTVWQEIDERCQTRRSWPDPDVRSVPAMSIEIVLLVLLVLAAGGVLGTVDAVRRDGYGPRPDRADRTADPRRLL
jgi:hypothetical protein